MADENGKVTSGNDSQGEDDTPASPIDVARDNIASLTEYFTSTNNKEALKLLSKLTTLLG